MLNRRRDLSSLYMATIVVLVGLLMIGSYVPLHEAGWTNEYAKIIIESVKEIGFAFIISVIVWVTFEYFTSNIRQREWDDRIKQINDDVFRAVLGKKIPQPIIDSVQRTVLDQALIREGMDLKFTLKRCSECDLDGGILDFISVQCVAKFKLRNILDNSYKYVPRIAISGHRRAILNKYCKLGLIRVDGKIIDVAAANMDLQKRLTTQKEALVFEDYAIIIESNNFIEIEMTYFSAKDQHDTEVFTSFFPSDGVSLEIIYDNNDRNRIWEINASSIHPEDLNQIPMPEDSGSKRYELKRHFLPFQGIQIWWDDEARSEREIHLNTTEQTDTNMDIVYIDRDKI